MNTLNSSFKTQVDSAILDLDTVSVNINYSNMSKSILDQKFDLNISDSMLSDMSDLFISLSGTELKADQVNLYDFSGYVLQAGLSTMVKKTDDSRTEWLQKAREADGRKVTGEEKSSAEAVCIRQKSGSKTVMYSKKNTRNEKEKSTRH